MTQVFKEMKNNTCKFMMVWLTADLGWKFIGLSLILNYMVEIQSTWAVVASQTVVWSFLSLLKRKSSTEPQMPLLNCMIHWATLFVQKFNFHC